VVTKKINQAVRGGIFNKKTATRAIFLSQQREKKKRGEGQGGGEKKNTGGAGKEVGQDTLELARCNTGLLL